MKRSLAWAAAAVGSLFLAAAPAASAAELLTWTTKSRYVDPLKEPFNTPPPGVAPRPNALRVNILLPDGYDGKRRFPVVYLLGGHGETYDSWMHPEEGNLLETRSGLEAIFVMPEGARSWYTNWWRGGQRLPGWERYHLDELVPMVERRLKVRRGRRWHAIAGLSMGGQGAMFYASQRPGYFGSAASFSGVLSIQRPEWPQAFNSQGSEKTYEDVYGDPQEQSFYAAGHNPTALVDNLNHTRLYLSQGDGRPAPSELNDISSQVSESYLTTHYNDFLGAARAIGARVDAHMHQGIHRWPYWRADLKDAITRWGLFGRVPARPASFTYETVQQRSEAFGYRFRFTQAPDALATFKIAGRTVRGTGAGRVRVITPCGRRYARRLPFTRTVRCRAPRRR